MIHVDRHETPLDEQDYTLEEPPERKRDGVRTAVMTSSCLFLEAGQGKNKVSVML